MEEAAAPIAAMEEQEGGEIEEEEVEVDGEEGEEEERNGWLEAFPPCVVYGEAEAAEAAAEAAGDPLRRVSDDGE